jgi:hypothetical protein
MYSHINNILSVYPNYDNIQRDISNIVSWLETERCAFLFSGRLCKIIKPINIACSELPNNIANCTNLQKKFIENCFKIKNFYKQYLNFFAFVEKKLAQFEFQNPIAYFSEYYFDTVALSDLDYMVKTKQFKNLLQKVYIKLHKAARSNRLMYGKIYGIK